MSSASEVMLRDFLKQVDTLQADFEQRITDEGGMTIETAKGIFSLSRPGRFRWDTASADPDFERGPQIVSNGESIIFYEPDLASANVRSFDEAVQQAPTIVLVQSGEKLDDVFTITDYGLTDGLSWVALRPKSDDAGFNELMIGFDNGALAQILITDMLANETRLRLTNVKTNQSLPAALFELELPEGVDFVH
ncbi:outer-membrane lipoprotein carrier protein [Arenicella chitinivorans]|uniref:Outer-membrane lipoprotein carrier protein n=2 Tax=Arenicella chitinivorans TaxID=1329800 RepID=A0A918RPS2_9GAMM|nr:outer-membrane lipoprotein carrier protein [Arenicella chitinivorans]